MSLISSKDVYIAGVTGIEAVKISRLKPQNSFSHSGVPGSVQTLAGDVSFAWQANGDGAQPGLFPLATGVSKQFTFLYEVSTKYSVTGTIFTSNLTINWDKANKQNPVTWTASGAFSGTVTPAATGTLSAGGFSALSAKDLDIEIDGSSITGGTSFASCLQNCSLTFTRPLTPVVCGNTVSQLPGNLSASMTIGLLDENIDSSVLTNDDFHEVKVIVDSDGNFWGLNYIQFGDVDGPSGNRASNTPVAMTVKGVYSAISSVGNGGIAGPDETAYFGTI